MARQVTQKEAADARKKKRTREVRWKQEKEQEIAQRVKAEEHRSDVESERHDFFRGGGKSGGHCDLCEAS